MSKRPFLRRGPSGPLAAQYPIVNEGYDQVVVDGESSLTVAASLGAMFPRNAALDPLKVELDGVTPGNVLEVDYRMTIARLSADYQTQFDFDTVAVVTFDGSAPAVPSAATSYIDNSAAAANDPSPGFPWAQKFTLTSLSNVTIPAGATKATVQLFYKGSSADVGLLSSSLAATLKVTEFLGDVVTQKGPGALVPTV